MAVTIFEDTATELPAPTLAPGPPVAKLLERTTGSIGSQDVAELGVKAAHMRGGMNIVFEARTWLFESQLNRSSFPEDFLDMA